MRFILGSILGLYSQLVSCSQSSDALKEALLATIKRPENEIVAMMEDIFSIIDTNKDNMIDEPEIKEWITKLSLASNKRHALIELKLIDKNKDGKVSWDEMKAAMSEVDVDTDPHSEQLLKKRISIADVDGDNMLDVKEMGYLLTPGLSPEMTLAEATDIMESQDTNKDGKISFEEFASHEFDQSESADQEELLTEFRQYDIDNDDYINLEEIKLAFVEPRPGMVKEAIEEILANKNILSREEFINEWTKYAKSSVTDRGNLLKSPKDYTSEISLPYENVEEFNDDQDYGTDSEEDNENYDKDEL